MTTFLTGIKPTGDPHFGNYISAIKPLRKLAKDPTNQIYVFIADGHSLTTHPDPKTLKENVLKVACAYTSLLPETPNVYIYRQSQIPEIFEMFWILSCLTAKGNLNRCHAYYSKTQENIQNSNDPDKGIFMGLYNYPVLMAADILSIQPDIVPIGKDQKQHLEITKEIVRKFNHIYKKEVFKQPEDTYSPIEIPGTDNRKMSKSYDNTVPVFCSSKTLRKKIFSFITNSKGIGDRKYREESPLVKFFETLVPHPLVQEKLDELLFKGVSWGDIKRYVYDEVYKEFESANIQYNELYNYPDSLYQKLRNNEIKVRYEVKNTLHQVKKDIGLL